MAIFAISYRIHDTATYDHRLRSLEAAIIAEDVTSLQWSETTSYYIIGSNRTTVDLADALLSGSSFDPHIDILIVVNCSVKEHAVRGNNLNLNIAPLMSKR